MTDERFRIGLIQQPGSFYGGAHLDRLSAANHLGQQDGLQLLQQLPCVVAAVRLQDDQPGTGEEILQPGAQEVARGEPKCDLFSIKIHGPPAERVESRSVSKTKSLVNCAKPPPRLEGHTCTTSDSQSPPSVDAVEKALPSEWRLKT